MYAKKFKIKTLVETGTYKGNMIIATRKTFKKIYSIELDDDLFKQAKEKFTKYKNIYLYKGESGKILPEILKVIKGRCLF